MRFLHTTEIDIGFFTNMRIYAHADNFPVVNQTKFQLVHNQQKVGGFPTTLASEVTTKNSKSSFISLIHP